MRHFVVTVAATATAVTFPLVGSIAEMEPSVLIVMSRPTSVAPIFIVKPQRVAIPTPMVATVGPCGARIRSWPGPIGCTFSSQYAWLSCIPWRAAVRLIPPLKSRNWTVRVPPPP